MKVVRTYSVGFSRSALSKGPNKVCVSIPLSENGNRSSYRNGVFSSYLEFRTLDKFHIPSDSEENRLYEIMILFFALFNYKMSSLTQKLEHSLREF
jgi:hypothetical protein